MLDLTNECEQREFARGPVPDGSIVMVEIEILKPNQERQAHDNPFISVASSGLRQIYCQFTVSHGQYQGVSFRQNITLPFGEQDIPLNDGQRTACNIGGATLKAMCVAAKKAPQDAGCHLFDGVTLPCPRQDQSSPNMQGRRAGILEQRNGLRHHTRQRSLRNCHPRRRNHH